VEESRNRNLMRLTEQLDNQQVLSKKLAIALLFVYLTSQAESFKNISACFRSSGLIQWAYKKNIHLVTLYYFLDEYPLHQFLTSVGGLEIVVWESCLERLNGWIVHCLAQQIQQVHVAIPTRMLSLLRKINRHRRGPSPLSDKGKLYGQERENGKKYKCCGSG
jgi:hypothetical protein